MSSPDSSTIVHLLENGPHRFQVGRKQLTLAFAGHYIVSTTQTAKPLLVWESEKGYARYYVPVQTLHADIKQQLTETDDDSKKDTDGSIAIRTPVVVEILEKVSSGNAQAQALVEKITLGARTTTWVRFTEGILKGHIRFERNEIDDWFENGALFASIKNPYKRIDTAAVSSHIAVKIDGQPVAETNVAVLLNETGLPETYYLPATSITDWSSIEKSTLKTACPYKGEAWYLSINVKGKKYENRIWYYPYPTHESAGVEGLISFYNKEDTEILVDGVKV